MLSKGPPPSELRENIKVFVRVRPSSENDGPGGACIVCDTKERQVTVSTKPDAKMFTYDHVADQETSQSEIYSMVGKSVAETCVMGMNATIFVYGQTGSGKTFTMQGVLDGKGHLVPETRGLIPRVLEYLFMLISRESKNSGGSKAFLCKASFLEIYNERIFDLLDPGANPHGLNIREDIKTGVFVENLVEMVVGTPDEAQKILEMGAANRRVSPTFMNAESSRSHSVFTLVVQSKETVNGVTNIRSAHLNLVDLAGSERQKATGALGEKLREASNINKSLSALGNVISALVDVTNGKSRHVSYRDSKLTFLLKDSLGGNTRTHIIACVSPAESNFAESLSTLQFADRAKKIKNVAKVNEDTEADVSALREELRRLKDELMSAKVAHGLPLASPAMIAGAVDPDAADSPLSGRIMQLEWLLQQQMEKEGELVRETQKMVTRIEDLQRLIDAKDKMLQGTRFVLRLREDRIQRLVSGGATAEEADAAAHLEIEELTRMVRCSPEAVQLGMENNDLRVMLQDYEDQFGEEFEKSRHDMVKLHAYANGLNQQLQILLSEKHSLQEALRKAREKVKDVNASRVSPSKTSSNIELQKWKAEMEFEGQLKELKAQLENTAQRSRTELHERDERLSEAELNNAALQREVQELASALASAKLTYQMELDALRDAQRSDREALVASEGGDAVAALEEQLAQAQAEKDGWQKKWEQSEAEHRALQAKVARFEKANQRMSISFTAKEKEDKDEVMHLAERLAQADASLATMRTRVEDSMSALAAAETELQLSRQHAADLTARGDALSSELDTLRIRYDEETLALERRHCELDAQMRSLQEEFYTVKGHNEMLVDEQQFTADQLASSQKALQKHAEMCRELQTSLKAAESRVEELGVTVDRLQGQLANGHDAVRPLQEENAVLTQTVEKARAALDAAEDAARSAQCDADAKGKELSILCQEKADAQHASAVLQDALTKARSDAASLISELEMRDADLIQARESIAQIEKDGDERLERINTLDLALERAKNDMDALVAEHARQTEDIMQELRTRDAELKAAQAHTAATEHKLQGDVANLESTLQSMQEALIQSDSTLCAAREQMESEALNDRLQLQAEHNAQHAAWEAAAAEGARERDTLTAQLAAARAEKADVEARLAAMRDAVEQGSTEAALSKDKIVELEDRHQKQVDFLQASIVALQNEKAAESEALAQLQRTHEEVKKMILRQNKDITTHKEKLVAFGIQATDWEKTREEKNAEISSLKEQLAVTEGARVALDERARALEAREESNLNSCRESEQTLSEHEAIVRALNDDREKKADKIKQMEIDSAVVTKELARLNLVNGNLKTALQTTLADLGTRLKESEMAREEEHQTFLKFEAMREEADLLREENAVLKTKSKEQAERVHTLNLQIAALQGHQNNKQKLRYVENLKEELNESQSQNDTLRVQLKKQENIAAGYKKKLMELDPALCIDLSDDPEERYKQEMMKRDGAITRLEAEVHEKAKTVEQQRQQLERMTERQARELAAKDNEITKLQNESFLRERKEQSSILMQDERASLGGKSSSYLDVSAIRGPRLSSGANMSGTSFEHGRSGALTERNANSPRVAAAHKASPSSGAKASPSARRVSGRLSGYPTDTSASRGSSYASAVDENA